MPTQVKCPSCSTVLRLPASLPPGGAVRCPKCATVLRAPGQASAKPPAPTASAPPVKAPTVAKRSAAAPPPQAIKPASAKVPPSVPRANENLDDEDDLPSRRIKKKKPKSKKGLLIGLGVGAAVLLLVCGGVTFGVYRLFRSGTEKIKQSLDEMVQQSKKKTLDVSFIHADCNAALVIQPARINQAKTPFLPADQRSKLVAEGLQATGIDFSKVGQIILVMEPAPPRRNPPRPQPGQQPQPAAPEPAPFLAAGILHFLERVDGMTVLDKALNQKDMVQAGGKIYYRSKAERVDGQLLAGYFDGDRTILLGPESMVKKMIAAKDVHSALTNRLQEFELENDIFGVFLMEPVKPMLQGLAQSPDIPPQLAEARRLDQTLVAVKIIANLDSDKLFQIILEGANDQSGASLEQLARNALDMGKGMYPQFKMGMQQGIPKEMPPEVSAKIFNVTDQIMAKDGITITKEGKNVIVTLK